MDSFGFLIISLSATVGYMEISMDLFREEFLN